MKRLLSFLMVAAMLLSLLPTAFAEDTVVEYAVEGGNIRFDLATGTVVGSDKSVTAAHIPETIEGVTVTAIGAYAFADLEQLGTQLKEITLPETITSIGHSAFYYCTNLEAIDLPDGIETIDYSTFFCCSSLKSADLPKDLKKICLDAFGHCESLTSIELPEGLEVIEDSVFNACKSLQEVNIPTTAKSVSAYFLHNSAYYLDEGNWTGNYLILDDWLVKIEDREYYCLDIPDGIKHIADWAGYGLNRMDEIRLPDGLLTIGDHAFGRSYVEELVIPESVTHIGAEALSGFNGLWLYFEGDAPEVEEGFMNPTSVQQYVFRTEGSEGWDAPVWANYDVRVWDGIKPFPREIWYPVTGGHISFSPMDNCINHAFVDVIDVKIPEQIEGYPVKKIAENAFSSMHSLVSVEIPATVEEIGVDAFRGTSLEYAVFYGNPPASFGERDGANDYNSVFWPDEDFTLYYADGTDWTTPEWNGHKTLPLSQVDHLHDFKLVSGEIPCESSLMREDYIFACSCGMEKTVNYLTSGHNYVDGVCQNCGEMPNGESGDLTWTFYEPTGTLTFYGDGAMGNYSEVNGEGTVPWNDYRTRVENIVFDGEVTHIGNYAFYKTPAITSIDLPESVITIGKNAFDYCASLMDINFPEGLETIGSAAFSHCNRLRIIELPNSLQELPENLFAYSVRLRTVRLPEQLKNLGNNAFYECISLESVILPETLIQLGRGVFYGCESLQSMRIPYAVGALGNSAFSRCKALKSVEIEGEIEVLGYGMFSGCESLTDVTLPNTVTCIGSDAFRGCHALQQIVLPTNLQKIEYTAFIYCISLTSVEFPDTLTEIQRTAFASCKSLTDVYFHGDAPTVGENVFKLWDNPSQAYILHPDLMLYYLDGAEGWTTPEWNGYPTAIWGEMEKPTEESTEPSEESTEPSEESTEPSEESTEPSEESTEPSEEPTEPSEESTEPSEESTEPSEESTEPSEEPSEPSEEPSEPSEEPSEPDEKPEEPAENPFADVKQEDYFFDPVLWAVGNGITNGMSETSFAPNDDCTRGQIVTFLWRACGSPEPMKTDNPFTDVAEGAYYYKAVLWAVENDITKGVSETTFEPNAKCTRGQVATFLWRSQDKPEPESTNNPFDDVKPDDYYFEAVLWAVENEVTQGMGDGKFAPNASCTRGQIVTFLYRALA